MKRFLFLYTLLLLPGLSHAGEDESKKLSVHHFASLKSAETNMRAGPGTRYSINWVYKHAAMPVEIIQEFDVWREIRDQEGTTGWVHKNMLSGRRMAVLTRKTRSLHKTPDDASPVILRAEPGVTGQLQQCEKDWCRLQIDSRKGWLKKTEFWGAQANEVFKD